MFVFVLRQGSRVMTRLLVQGGASLDAVDVNGNGVVHAAVCDSPAVLAILIDNGADVTVPNNDGLTPKVRSSKQTSLPCVSSRACLSVAGLLGGTYRGKSERW